MSPEQVTELITLLERFSQAEDYRSSAAAAVVTAARQYAMVVTTGQYFEQGALKHVHVDDQQRYANFFLDDLKRYSVNLLTEEIASNLR